MLPMCRFYALNELIVNFWRNSWINELLICHVLYDIFQSTDWKFRESVWNSISLSPGRKNIIIKKVCPTYLHPYDTNNKNCWKEISWDISSFEKKIELILVSSNMWKVTKITFLWCWCEFTNIKSCLEFAYMLRAYFNDS